MMREAEKSPAQIESEIVRTRSEMGRTLDALQSRLSPGQMLDGVLGQLGSGSGEFASSLGRSIRANPMPVTLMGIGLGWLMVSSGMRRSRPGGSGAALDETRPRPSSTRSDRPAGHSVAGAGTGKADESSGGRIGGVVAGIRDRADSARRRTAELGAEGNRRAAQARRRIGRFVDEQPLLLGAVGTVIGAMLGASLPATRRENQLLGETRDRLKDRAVETGSRRIEDVEGVVDAAVRTAKDEAARRGLVPPSGDRSDDKERSGKRRSEKPSA